MAVRVIRRDLAGVLTTPPIIVAVGCCVTINLSLLPWAQGVATPVAATFQIPDQLHIRGKDPVVILADGRLGNLRAQVQRSIARGLAWGNTFRSYVLATDERHNQSRFSKHDLVPRLHPYTP
jgi:hypothetical protein